VRDGSGWTVLVRSGGQRRIIDVLAGDQDTQPECAVAWRVAERLAEENGWRCGGRGCWPNPGTGAGMEN
jgi:hypothetical protein